MPLLSSLCGVAVLAAVALSPSALADERPSAACVGGPRAPSYAFKSWSDAYICKEHIASESHECAASVRTGTCYTEHYNIDNYNPHECRCNPGFWIGDW